MVEFKNEKTGEVTQRTFASDDIRRMRVHALAPEQVYEDARAAITRGRRRGA